ncbi:MAG: hypothetical protein HY016_04360 [Nitrosomonadales bacterium]|nr:hypothetical protein [Nitrosomonadales bacterium]
MSVNDKINFKRQLFKGGASLRMMSNHPFATMVLLALIFSPVMCDSIYGYSTWEIDEQVPVVRALGFLDFDFDPHWFGYHTLPMYLFSAMYAVIYEAYRALGWVDSKLEFASLLFSKDAAFFISGRLLCCFAYLLGSAVIARMFYLSYRSKVGCALLFMMLLFLPDAHAAMNIIRVDTFVFLFLTLLIYFSCFHQKNLGSFVLSVVFCGAAIASKIPAIIFAPILFISVLRDVRMQIYPQKYLLLFPAILLLSIFSFMPYAFISYQEFLLSVTQAIGIGASVHFGKATQFEWYGQVLNLFTMLKADLGIVGLMAACIYGAITVIRKNQAIFPVLYAGGYSGLFMTSTYLDEYWLRPVFPFLLLFAFSLIYEVDLPAGVARIGNKLFNREFPLVGHGSAGTWALPVIFTGIFLVHNATVFSSFYDAISERREDTRITSANWIRNHLSPDSTIYMHGSITSYLPQLLSTSPRITLEDTFLDFMSAVSKNIFLSNAFYLYFKKEITSAHQPTFSIIDVGPLGIDQTKGFKSNGYVVMSSYNFQRYFDQDIEHMSESVKPRLISEKKAIEFIRNQTPIASFDGRGPRIEIYQIK